MKISKGFIIGLVIFVLIPVCVFFALSSRSYKSLYYNNLLETSINKHKIESYRNKFQSELYSDNLFIDNGFLIKLSGDSVRIKDIVKTPKLVYCFYEESCQACVTSDIFDLEELGVIIGNSNIIIVSDYKNRKLLAFMQAKRIESPCYTYNSKFGLPIEMVFDRKASFFFILDSDLKIHFPYRSDDDTSFNRLYLKRIKQYFQNWL